MFIIGTSFVYRDISFFRSNRPTSEGRLLPVRARLLRVTQKVSSNSIHTLLCSDEHKNPPSGGLRENRFQPQHKAERFILSLGYKAEASETTFQKTKLPNVTIPTTPRHFRQKLYNRYFLTVETNVRPSVWTAEGRREQTDKQPNNPSGIRTSVGSDIGWLRRWAIERNIHSVLWLCTD